MSYIQNQVIRLGINLYLGGAITYLAPVDQPELNVVNSFDWGRQIQLSYYSGPVPFQPPGTTLSDAWKGLGWNPIQSGDAFRNRSRLLSYRNTGRELYVKCVPMQWPLNNVAGECECEVWIRLEGQAVNVKCRLTNRRSDLTQYPARTQELPAVYVNGPYYHLITYTGDSPFQNAPYQELHNRLDKEGNWTTWLATEGWAAQVDDRGWGLGIWNPATNRISGGFAGEPGEGGPNDSPTGYLAPNRNEILDHDIVYEYHYYLFLGSINEIRGFVYRLAVPDLLPAWFFSRDRRGWYLEGASDRGWPIKDSVQFTVGSKPDFLVSPEFVVKAQKTKGVEIRLAADRDIEIASLQINDLPVSVTPTKVQGDGQYHSYRIPFKFDGALISKLKLGFKRDNAPIAKIKIHSVKLIPTGLELVSSSARIPKEYQVSLQIHP